MAAAPGAFSRRSGSLYVEECSVTGLAERHGTPLHVVSEAALRNRAREFQRDFRGAWPHGTVTILPAIKANYAVALHRILAEEGCGADLFGAGELEVAVRAGIDPSLLSLNGTAKDAATIRRAVGLGARVTLDSVHEIELARQAALEFGKRAEVRVRVRPLVTLEAGSEPYGGLPMREAFGRYKPGIPWDDLDAAGAALTAPELDLSGVMMHFGRHTTDLEEIGHVIDRYAELIAELQRRWDGWTPRVIDVGGGIAHHADPHGRAGQVTPPARSIPTVREYAETICSRLTAGLVGAGIDPAGRSLEVEPGRALFGPVGIHLSRVLHTKRQTVPFPHRWVELDTSQTHLPDIALERCRYPIALADGATADEPYEQCDVVGVACSSDVLAHGEPLPPLPPGTIVALGLTGAYQDAGATNFNVMPRAAVVLVDGASAHVIKRAETVEDVLSRDVVPAHLRLLTDTGPSSPLGLDHAGVTCTDIDASLAFYQGLLGIPLRARGENEVVAAGNTGAHYLWADLELPDGRVVELVQPSERGLEPLSPGTGRPGSAHTGLRVADVHDVLARLAVAGIEPLSPPAILTEPGAWNGCTIAYVRDPDGHAVELVQHP